MVVLAIISLIATLAVPRLVGTLGRAKTQTARLQLENVRGALQMFYIDTGRYPTEAEGLQALVEQPQALDRWLGPYMDENMTQDPWGRGIGYRYPGTSGEFDLYSYGRDGQPGGTMEDTDINL